MIKISIPKIPSPIKFIGNIEIKRNKTFKEISVFAKEDIKKELRSPNKKGRKKPLALITKYPLSPARRSAKGQSLARETGKSEKLIASSIESDKLKIGFLKNPNGDNYVREHELENDRPTISESQKRSLPKIIKTINKNFNL